MPKVIWNRLGEVWLLRCNKVNNLEHVFRQKIEMQVFLGLVEYADVILIKNLKMDFAESPY